MKCLFLTTVLPANRQRGGEVATQTILTALQQSGHTVMVVGYLRQGDDFTSLPPNARVVEERPIETSNAGWQKYFWWVVSWGKRLPYSAAKYVSSRYRHHVGQLLKTESFDAVILDHAQLGWLLPIVPTDMPLVLVAHNVEHQIYNDQARQQSNPLKRWVYIREARLMQKLEKRIAAQTAQVWTLTAADAGYFAGIP